MRQSSELNWCQQLVRPLFFRGKDQKSNPEYSKVESDNQFVNQLYISFVIVKPEATNQRCLQERKETASLWDGHEVQRREPMATTRESPARVVAATENQ
jgi:hypothetical protein